MFRNDIKLTRERRRVLREKGGDEKKAVDDLRDLREEFISEDLTQHDVDQLFLSLAAIEIKNRRFAEDVAEAAKDEFIIVPDNRYDIIKSVRTLLPDYEINGGKRIPFVAFKKLVDDATRPVNVQEFVDSLSGDPIVDSVFMQNMSTAYENPDALRAQRDRYEEKIDITTDEPSMWLSLGIAAGSLVAMESMHRMSARWTEKNKEQEDSDDDAVARAAAATPEEKAKVELAITARKRKKWLVRLIKVAKAVAFFILFHKLSERQAEQMIDDTIQRNNIPDEFKDQMVTMISNEVDNPPDDVKELLLIESGGDSRLIVEFCLQYIDDHPEKDYAKWILYSQSMVRARNLRNITNQGRAYMSDEAVKTSNRFSKDMSRTETVLTNMPTVPDFYTEIDPVNGRTPRHMSKSYWELLGEHRDNSNIGINYARRLLNSNRYNPALICCIMKYLGTLDIDFLKKLRATFKMLGAGFGFNASRYAKDLASAMYGDLQEQILIPLLGIIDTTVNIWIRDNITDWLLDLEAEHETLFKCTPIRDMAVALAGAIQALSDWLQDLLEKLFDLLFKLEINDGSIFPALQGSAKFRNLYQLLDLVINILDRGESCDVRSIRDNVNSMRKTEPDISLVDNDEILKELYGDDAGGVEMLDLDGNPLDNNSMDYDNSELDSAGGRELPTDEEISIGYSRDTVDAILKNEFCYKRMTADDRSVFESEAKAVLDMLDEMNALGGNA